MFIEDGIVLPDHVQEYLRSFERPIRVLKGNAHNFDPPASWSGMARINGASIEDCEQTGVTLVSWGCDSVADGMPYDYRNNIPGYFYEDNEPRQYSRDWLIPRAQNDNTFNDGSGFTWARVGERVVWFLNSISSDSATQFPYDGLNLDRFFGDPIRRAIALDSAEEREERERLRREEERERAMRNFIEGARRSRQTRADQVRREISYSRDNIREYERSIATAFETIRTQTRELEGLEAASEGDEEQIQRQWEALLAHPKITDISASDSYFVVKTVGLDLTSPDTGDSCYLGEFEIKVPISARFDEVRFTNLDNWKTDSYGDGRREHPHVERGGYACFGDLAGLLGTTLSNNELAAAVELLLQYLESYNPDDSWGQYADWWFNSTETTVSREERERQEREERLRRDREALANDPNAPVGIDGCTCAACREARGEI